MRSEKIIGLIHENGYNNTSFASGMGMAPRTLKRKLRRGVMGSDEIELACEMLGLDSSTEEKEPARYFFEKWVTSKVTKGENQ